jgi:hypothetical protein
MRYIRRHAAFKVRRVHDEWLRENGLDIGSEWPNENKEDMENG